MEHADTITIRFPAPSDGMETVMVLVGIGAFLVAVLGAFRHWDRITAVLSKYPWERASKAANLLSLVALVTVGPVAAGLFTLAVVKAFSLLTSEGASETAAGSFGRGAVIVALIGAPFVIWRAVVAQKTVNVTEQGHITERINTAVQGLGAEKTVKRWNILPRDSRAAPLPGETPKHITAEYTEPNLEVRIGAIYALERIAQDSDRDHVQIMEILCAYIRQNAPAPQVDDWPELMREGDEDGPLAADWDERLQAFRAAEAEANSGLKPREDIQVALTVIGRRSEKQRQLEAGRGVAATFPFDRAPPEYAEPEDGHDPAALDAYKNEVEEWQKAMGAYGGYRLDLRKADLRGADLSRLNLNGAMLDGTFLQGASLVEARLQGARLSGARLQGAFLLSARLQTAVLWKARLQGAALFQARLQGADLMDAQLQGAPLLEARLQGTRLWWAWLQGAALGKARLQGADLMGARLQGADLNGARFDPETDLSKANFRGAAARSIDFTDIPEIADHLDGMFGDGSVTLSEGCDRPAHWPRQALYHGEFKDEWRKWRADPKGDTPPDTRGG